ncbi:PREDICTED: chordin-like [Nanorana parkeri]|uniref:chordin-like n=1 Tax=Nanorana parkeri TaxID=125878 RepID=UPI0008546AE6|nr:PREDICTED: chordin-like [Nanorana parkeri]
MVRSPSTFLLLLLLWTLDVGASRRKILLPIKPEQDLVPSKSQIGCHLGGKIYSLDDTWHPDLGKPFGVAYCVLCRCEAQRSRWGKESGKISCRSIKSHCVPLACANPVEVPGQCCRVCPKTPTLPPLSKKSEFAFDEFEYFQEKDDELYNDRSYLSSDDVGIEDGRTEFVSFLTTSSHVGPPVKSSLAKAKFNLQRSNLLFSITYKGTHSFTRVRFTDIGGSVLFEHPVHRVRLRHSDTICGLWRSVPRSSLHLLRQGHILVSLVMETLLEPEISGKILRHKALFSESFSALLTPDEEGSRERGLAMLTLSTGDDDLHFILMLRGIQEEEQEQILVTVQILHHHRVIRALCANITVQETDFAEVFPNLSSREMLWLAQGQLEIAVQMDGDRTPRISGLIAVRKSCDTLQSVLSGGDALNPTKTGAVGSATITLHENGTVEYQLQVAGVMSEVTAVTLETKPRRPNRRNILHDLTEDYHGGKAHGLWTGADARDLHMLLHGELFLNVATKDFQDGEVRGRITPLPFSGLWARHEEFPIPLAGRFVSPSLMTGSAGHAWVSLDEHCHLQYQIVVTGLGRAEDAALNAHLHGFAELGEVGDGTHEQKKVLKGFYGSEAQGSVKDLDTELFRHLNRGAAFIQVSTKLNPRGEIRGQVHIPNSCESGGTSPSPGNSREAADKSSQRHPDELRRDPRSCHFEGKLRAHGSRWAPDYDRKCSVCSCQKRTVICDPIVCQPLNCSRPIQPEESCCPVCDENKEILEGRSHRRSNSDGCYFNGEWRSAGTRWHPRIEPFGLVLCATCSCKASSQDLHCVRQSCPPLSCANPIRTNPMDCCKKCPEEEQKPAEGADAMQSDEPRQCKVMGHLYSNNERWHPTVPRHGAVPCVTCVCQDGVPQCKKQKWKCSDPECGASRKPDRICCSECHGECHVCDI